MVPIDIIIEIYHHCDTGTKLKMNRVLEIGYRKLNPYINNLTLMTYIRLHKFAEKYYKHSGDIIYNIMKRLSNNDGYRFIYNLTKESKMNWYNNLVYEECILQCECDNKCYINSIHSIQ